MNILNRFWIYQDERFPLKKTVPLLAVFSAASICVSAELAGRSLPNYWGYIIGFIIAICLFFQMRVCDEIKDIEDDTAYRPNRPIPRGLVSLNEVKYLGIFTMGITFSVTLLWSPPLLWLLALVWVWLFLMTAEFWVPTWLKMRPILYLISHMMIMPLIDLLLTGVEWVPAGEPSSSLTLFLCLSFVNGCVLEIGRKLWAPANEIDGVETYSKLWGVKHGTIIWFICLLISFSLLSAIGFATGVGFATMILGSLGVLVCFKSARSYLENPSQKTQKNMDTISGLWVFISYILAGFLPLIIREIT